MDALRFSPEDKRRIRQNILEYQNQQEKRRTIMNKWTFPKAAVVAAALLLVTGGTVFAASKIATYHSWSNSYYDYTSVAEMNEVASGSTNDAGLTIPEFPETLGSYAFDGGNTVHVAGADDTGNTVGKWDELSAVYKNPEGSSIFLEMSLRLPDEDDRTPTEVRTIDGIDVTYNYDEYLVLPNEDEPLDPAIEERMNNDDHFFVSYGSDEAETFFFSGARFIKDGISYLIFSTDEIPGDDLFAIAAELIGR